MDLPPIEEQKKIASVLSGLRRKMAYNVAVNGNLLLRANRFLGSRRFPNIPTTEPKMDSIAMPGRILHHRHQAEPVLH
ncbi:hypothetical protein [Acetatifactor muris]|uniref:hypothetical protein n=1 Tax=Acetatifactor muris TaxID=879566 RepID=UPI003A7F29BF